MGTVDVRDYLSEGRLWHDFANLLDGFSFAGSIAMGFMLLILALIIIAFLFWVVGGIVFGLFEDRNSSDRKLWAIVTTILLVLIVSPFVIANFSMSDRINAASLQETLESNHGVYLDCDSLAYVAYQDENIFDLTCETLVPQEDASQSYEGIIRIVNGEEALLLARDLSEEYVPYEELSQ